MALTPEQIDAEAFARWGDMKGAPLAMCRGFARAIEAAARRDALEEAAKLVQDGEPPPLGEKLRHVEIGKGAREAYATAIRKLKEDIQ